ncbi:hypothetical protein PI125_g3478 [Phytophthora idaei]|nr:hypothetical protein PI125_g3478 [Phytophthora idaei]KAG3167789.1 hypothetical protein PI126_g3647 [Phytophthora idaei]
MYKMLERYFELHPVLDADDDGIMELMPSRRQVNRLKVLLGKLVDFQSATMKLQDDGMTLLDVRDIFDALIEKHPVVGTYLSADAAIIKDPDFESACVLALSGRIEGFTGDQQLMLHPFETTPQAVIRTPRVDVLRALRTKYWRPERSKERRRRCSTGCASYPRCQTLWNDFLAWQSIRSHTTVNACCRFISKQFCF